MSETVTLPATAFPDLGIPEYAQPERILFNTQRIGRMAALGGFHGDVLISGYQGEATEYTPGVTGHGADGSAFASMVGSVKKAPLANVDMGAPDPLAHIQHDLRLSVNTAELTDRLERQRANVRDPAAWASHLDRAVKEGLRDAAWQHMVRRRPPDFEKAISIVFGGILMAAPLFQIGEVSPAQTAGAFAAGYTGVLLVNNLGMMSGLLERRHVMTDVREGCYSMVPMWHVDRAAAVSVGTRLGKFVKAAKA
jgi:hypothetical protein